MPEIGRHLPFVLQLPERGHPRQHRRPRLLIGGQGEPGVASRRRLVAERLGEDLPAHHRIEIAPERFDGTGLGEGPAGAGIGLAHNRVEEEQPMELANGHPAATETLEWDIAVLLLEDGIDIGRRDPPGGELGPVAFLGQVGLGFEQPGGHDRRLIERHRLERLERILRHEHADRPLLREDGGGPRDHRPEGFAVERGGIGPWQGGRHRDFLGCESRWRPSSLGDWRSGQSRPASTERPHPPLCLEAIRPRRVNAQRCQRGLVSPAAVRNNSDNHVDTNRCVRLANETPNEHHFLGSPTTTAFSDRFALFRALQTPPASIAAGWRPDSRPGIECPERWQVSAGPGPCRSVWRSRYDLAAPPFHPRRRPGT